MRNLIKSLLIIIFLAILQLAIYDHFFKPIITTWGASEEEITLPMAGDDKAQTITSTRAILINAPKSDVWQWLIQLGADRGGFYSYYFIEKALGYETRHQKFIKPEFKNLSVGDLVRGSIYPEKSIIPYNFRVIYVKPQETFVLENWGTFLLKEINNQQTRLIIRTQEPETSNHWLKAANYIAIPLHYMMERRTLMGIKARVEAGENVRLSNANDLFWFAGIVLSGLLICIYIFIARGFIQSIFIPFIFSIFWVLSLLIFEPIALYSIGLLLIISIFICGLMKINYAASFNGLIRL